MIGLAPTRRWRLTGGLALAVVLAILALWLPGSALTASLPVNTTDDVVAPDGKCSLREAISAANNDAPVFLGQGECPAGNGADTIVLPAGQYELGGAAKDDGNASGDLDVLGVQPLTIAGAGAAATTIDGNGVDRVIDVRPSRVLTLQGVTITGGHSPDGANGTPAVAMAAGQNVSGGVGGSGEPGGGIRNEGTLTIIDGTVAGNSAGDGGDGGSGQGGAGADASTGGNGGFGASGNAGNGGPGGGIYTTGNLSLTRVRVADNVAGAGGHGGLGIGGQGGIGFSGSGGAGGGGFGGDEGDGGLGGGIMETSTGVLSIDQSVISGNHAGDSGAGGLGQGGVGGASVGGAGSGGAGGPGNGGDSGDSGDGGGVVALSSLSISRSLIVGNSGGFGGNGGAGTGCQGGARAAAGGTGGDGGDSHGGDGHPGGAGGGVLTATNPAVARTIVNSTITGNSTGAGGNGATGTGGKGGGVTTVSTAGNGGDGTGGTGGPGGSGAGIDTEFSTTLINHATISSNTLGAPGAGGAGVGGAGGGAAAGGTPGSGGSGTGGAGGSPGTGGGVLSGSVSVVPTLMNSIVAANSQPSCDGLITNGGHNIVSPDAGCPGSNVDPNLLALADNGGPTMTQALGAGSPALDAVPVGGAGCLATDQRGVPRPAGPGCDIGALELAPPAVVTGGADGVSDTGATLTGQVTPNGAGTTYHFEIGQTTAYGTLTPGQAAGAGVDPVAVSAAVQGLTRATTYHYRLVATSANGTTAGTDRTFTTGAAGTDTTAPVFSSASLSRKVFAVNPRGRAEVPVSGAKRGTTFRYTLSEGARVLFTIHRVLPGRRVRGKCRKPTLRNRSRPRCKRYVSPRRFAAQAVAGANRKRFSGRIGKRPLRPGRYRATLVATDAAGNRSKPKRLTFRVVRR